jgi:hypothetical protein
MHTWNRLSQQILDRKKNTHDLRARLPLICLEDTNAHASLLVICDVGVVDSGLEGDGGWLEWVVGWKDEEELEFAALAGC